MLSAATPDIQELIYVYKMEAESSRQTVESPSFLENSGRQHVENMQPRRSRKETGKGKAISKSNFRQVSLQRKDQMINEKLASIKIPTINLPPIEYNEQKFSGRSRLFVANLPQQITEQELSNLFSVYGEVSEIFLHQSKSYGFIKLDYSANAERAKTELINTVVHGRSLIVRTAHPPTIRVKNLPPYVSNELLHLAFSVFGEIERAYIIVDSRGKPTSEGIVEYLKRSSVVSAIRKCSENCFFLTSCLQPVVVEINEPQYDTAGFMEATIRKSPEYYQERENGPRFAIPGTFQFAHGERWKELYKNYEAKLSALKAERSFEEQKLNAQMMSAQYDHETERLKELLRIREMDGKRFKEDWEMRKRQLEAQSFRDNTSYLYTQASQLNSLLDLQEQQLQRQWEMPFKLNWEEDYRYEQRIKRPRQENASP